jgi:hypothetical protein
MRIIRHKANKKETVKKHERVDQTDCHKAEKNGERQPTYHYLLAIVGVMEGEFPIRGKARCTRLPRQFLGVHIQGKNSRFIAP